MDIVEAKGVHNQRHPWELARFDILYEYISRYLPQEGIKHILDIGCGDCFFAAELLKKRSDIKVIGVDTAYSAEEIRLKKNEMNQANFELFSSLEEASGFLGNHATDLVLLLDVVEHIKDDVSFLSNLGMHECIDQETKVLITVPAYQHLFTEHDVFLQHYRRYNLKNLKKVIIASGFSPIDSGYFFLSLLPVRLFQKIKEITGFKQPQKGIGEWKRSGIITNFMKKCLLFDNQFLKLFHKAGITLPGLSAYCLCKKPV